MEATIFYILATVTVIATVFAITEKHTVHAIMYVVTSFFALAVIFFMLAAPVVAVFEVILYAGAIMVLFLFIIMMLDLGHPEKAASPGIREWWPAMVLGGIVLSAIVMLLTARAPAGTGAVTHIGVREFALALFRKYGIAVEIISMQLLFALVGALYLGKSRAPSPPAPLPKDRDNWPKGEGGQRPGEGVSS